MKADTYILIHIILNATNEQLLDSHTSLGFANLVTGNGALCVHRATINLVWPVLLCLVNHVGLRERHEAEPTGSLRLGVLHHHDVNDLAVLFKVCLQTVIGGAVVQPTDEQLSHLLRL